MIIRVDGIITKNAASARAPVLAVEVRVHLIRRVRDMVCRNLPRHHRQLEHPAHALQHEVEEALPFARAVAVAVDVSALREIIGFVTGAMARKSGFLSPLYTPRS